MSALPLSILMVDDNPFFARHVEHMCVAHVTAEGGGGWAWAQTPAEAVAQANRLRPELILLDPALHADEPERANFCRELAAAAAPTAPAFLFFTNSAQPLDELFERLAADPPITAAALAKPFGLPELTEKIAALIPPVAQLAATLTPAMANPLPPDPAPPAARFAWLAATPGVTGYAQLTPDGEAVEWRGQGKDQGPHGALIYLQRLASLCGQELGLGQAAEVQTAGSEGCALSVRLPGGHTLNVLASPQVNLGALAARVPQEAEA